MPPDMLRSAAQQPAPSACIPHSATHSQASLPPWDPLQHLRVDPSGAQVPGDGTINHIHITDYEIEGEVPLKELCPLTGLVVSSVAVSLPVTSRAGGQGSANGAQEAPAASATMPPYRAAAAGAAGCCRLPNRAAPSLPSNITTPDVHEFDVDGSAPTHPSTFFLPTPPPPIRSLMWTAAP